MSKESRGDWPPPREVAPPPVYNVHRPGDKGTADPFRQFKLAARDDGKPYKSPEPKAEQGLLKMLGTNGVVVVMGCLLAAVVVVLLILLATRV
jgi:hypothetical protein